MSTAVAVVERGEVQPSLEELTAEAQREHASAEATLERACELVSEWLEHAIRCGEIIASVKDRLGFHEWGLWGEENFPNYWARYHRIWLARDELRASGVKGKDEALARLDHIRPWQARQAGGYPLELHETAQRLLASGTSVVDVAASLGISVATVRKWRDPETARRKLRAQRRRDAKARKALREREEARALRHAVKKAGAAEAELYAMAEKMQDLMAQAHREAVGREKRAHYAKAGEHYRKWRDEIVAGVMIPNEEK